MSTAKKIVKKSKINPMDLDEKIKDFQDYEKQNSNEAAVE